MSHIEAETDQPKNKPSTSETNAYTPVGRPLKDKNKPGKGVRRGITKIL